MIEYNNYAYLYPPRAEYRIKSTEIGQYDNDEFIAQPKYDGDCSVVFIRGDELIVRNRHNEPKDHVDKSIDLAALKTICPGWLVLAGEMLDKAKKDENGVVLKGFVPWDILVYDGKHLVGSTLRERLDLLSQIFTTHNMRVTDKGIVQYEHLLFTQFEGIYLAPVYEGYLQMIYDHLILTDLYEGMILKKINAKLEQGFNEKNNSTWQLKVRKPKKIYRH